MSIIQPTVNSTETSDYNKIATFKTFTLLLPPSNLHDINYPNLIVKHMSRQQKNISSNL